jgi:ABC-2 family transporter protein
MLSVLLWKEYREHRLVWTALAFLGAATVLSRSILLGAGWLEAHSEAREILCALAVMLIGAYALICGAMMLAGEYENRTMSYLDALPGLRRRLWQGKFLAGVLLVLGQIVLLMCLAAAVSLFQNWRDAALTLAGMLVAGLYGLSWGMLFSSFGRSVMTVILLSLAGQVVTYLLTGLLAGFVFVVIYGAETDRDPRPLWVAFFAITAPAALVGSALVFTRLDRRRLWAVPAPVRVQRRALHPSWSMLFWLTWRQARGFAVGLAAFALFLGFIVPLEAVLLWPAATLIVGVLCGATAFADEQQGPYRFLGDQRLPLFRLWVVKVGVRFGVAVAAALLVLAPSFMLALANIPVMQYYSREPFYFFARVFQSDLFVDVCPAGLFLTLWLMYGFSSGCLCGLLFRHGLAAGVFALFTSILTTALWIPSLLGGGLHGWQVLVPPVLLLASTPLLMRPWAAGRIVSWTTAARLIPFVVLAGLWIAGGLWYRILEIPYVSTSIDLAAFRASLPTPEENEGGRLFRSACLHFDELSRSLRLQEAPQAGAAGMMTPAPAAAVPGIAAPAPMPGAPDLQTPHLTLAEREGNAFEHGWPADDHALAAWLDKLYAGEWAPMLKQAADLPTGPFDDVRNMTPLSLLPATQPAREVAFVLAVRGLQRQAAGDDEAYVENLRIGLALSRSLRDHAPFSDLLVGRAVEGVLVGGLDRWLEKLHGRSDLVHKALALLSRHLDETAEDLKDQELVEFLSTQNTVDDPLPWLQMFIANGIGQRTQSDPRAREEAEWVAMAWLIPWERARQARILGVMFEGDPTQLRWLYSPANNLGPLVQFGPYRLVMDHVNKPGRLGAGRAMQLKLALRWFQADNGKPAENLDELVPKYLPSIPLDPYDGAPFRYRLSRGEEIEWPSDPPDPNAPAMPPMGGQPGAVPVAVQPPTRKIPPGQGVLWCVGEDKVDDGGHRQSRSSSGETVPGGDIVFLVPLPPKAK